MLHQFSTATFVRNFLSSDVTLHQFYTTTFVGNFFNSDATPILYRHIV